MNFDKTRSKIRVQLNLIRSNHIHIHAEAKYITQRVPVDLSTQFGNENRLDFSSPNCIAKCIFHAGFKLVFLHCLKESNLLGNKKNVIEKENKTDIQNRRFGLSTTAMERFHVLVSR